MCVCFSQVHHSQGMDPLNYCQMLLLKTTLVYIPLIIMTLGSIRLKVIAGMIPVLVVAAEAPARVVTCQPTEQLPVGIGQTIVDHNKQSTHQGSHMSQLDMYQA